MKRENIKTTKVITLLLDLLCVISAFYLSGIIRGGIINEFGTMNEVYGNILLVMILSTLMIGNVSHNVNICKRGFYQECASLLKDQAILCLILFGYIIVMKEADRCSRIFLIVFLILNFMITYVVRSYMKMILILVYRQSSSSNKVMLVTISKNVSRILKHIKREYDWQIQVNSIALWDKSNIGDVMEGIEVVADKDNMMEMVRRNVVDEVFICLPNDYNIEIEDLILALENMGVIIHLKLDLFHDLNVRNKVIEGYAGHQVITFSTNYFNEEYAIIKRIIDIIGGLVGCILTIIVTLILAPAILIESPGAIFFSQIRVGKNGRKFKIYKFRSMYRDAEKRKAELMAKNEMKGLMFKMTDDPRITKMGKFIRKTSLDEFPQFFNVLKGDMSLVGTRPPTQDEFEQYEAWHKRRLSFKPGLTGMWQVSGRSDIEDFEDVVKMDLQYIDNWTLLLDFKILIKTLAVVLLRRGSK